MAFFFQLSIVSCSLLGTFGVIVAFDRYFGSTLAFAVLNLVRRATVPGFESVVILWPIQVTGEAGDDNTVCAVP